MRHIALSLIGIVCMTLPALAAEKRPQWVDGTSVMYPSEKYVTGTGVGEDRATAENRARAAVASVFSTRVSSTTVVGASERSSGAGVESSQSVEQQIRTATDRVMEGVEIAETWRDPASNQVWALAVINRYKAAQALQQKIDELESAAKLLLKKLNGEDRLERARAGGRIIGLSRRRDEAVADLRILLPAKAAMSSLDWAAARAAATKAVGELKVVVVAQGHDQAQAVASALSAALGELGVGARVGESAGEGNDLVVSANVSMAVPGKPDHGWHWRYATVNVTVTDTHEAKTAAAFESNAREAASSPDIAADRVVRSVGKKAGQDLGAALTRYFEGT